MGFIPSERATARLREGLSDKVTELVVSDIHTGREGATTIEMVFKEETSLDQVMADQDLVTDTFYDLLREVPEDGSYTFPSFVLRRESAEHEVEADSYE